MIHPLEETDEFKIVYRYNSDKNRWEYWCLQGYWRQSIECLNKKKNMKLTSPNFQKKVSYINTWAEPDEDTAFIG